MIKMLANNELDMDVLEIKDIIDIELLQKFQDDFALAMNCASVTVDKNGKPITNPSSYTRFCDGFVHSTKKGDDRCAASHKRMGEEATRTGKPFVGACHAGLIDFAAPIIVEGKLIGTVLGGQMLSETPKEQNYIQIAKEIQNLAENSKQTAISISELTTKIQESVNGTIKNSKITLETTKEQSLAMEAVGENIQDSVSIVEQLSNMMEKLK